MTLPLIQLSEVFHVGTLDPAEKGKRFSGSYEGHGLSVSLDPEAWTEIARLGGYPCWRLRSESGSFLNAHALSKTQRKAISAWGIEQGYVERVTVWTVSYWDDEMEDEMTMICDSYEDAKLDAESFETRPKRKTMLRGTALLTEKTGMKAVPGQFDHLLVLYVEEETALDGVWWADDYAHLSAPRGCILPGRLDRWQTEPCALAEALTD